MENSEASTQKNVERQMGPNPRSTMMDALRLRLAMWLWPKTVRQGDYFTLTAILQFGKPCNDGSWVGHTLRADKVEGDRIHFSDWSRYAKRFDPVGHALVPGVNCSVKLVKAPSVEQEGNEVR